MVKSEQRPFDLSRGKKLEEEDRRSSHLRVISNLTNSSFQH